MEISAPRVDPDPPVETDARSRVSPVVRGLLTPRVVSGSW